MSDETKADEILREVKELRKEVAAGVEKINKAIEDAKKKEKPKDGESIWG